MENLTGIEKDIAEFNKKCPDNKLMKEKIADYEREGYRVTSRIITGHDVLKTSMLKIIAGGKNKIISIGKNGKVTARNQGYFGGRKWAPLQ